MITVPLGRNRSDASRCVATHSYQFPHTFILGACPNTQFGVFRRHLHVGFTFTGWTDPFEGGGKAKCLPPPPFSREPCARCHTSVSHHKPTPVPTVLGKATIVFPKRRKNRRVNSPKQKTNATSQTLYSFLFPTNRAVVWGDLGGRKKGILHQIDVDDFLYIAPKSMIKAIRKGSSHAL